MEEDDEDEREDVAERVDQALGQVHRGEDRLQEVGDGGFGDGAQGQGADGDAELGRRHHLGQVLQAVHHLAGAAGTGRGEGFDLAAAHGDEGELRADEEAVGQDQECGEDQLDEAHRAASSTAVSEVSAPAGSATRTKRTFSAR